MIFTDKNTNQKNEILNRQDLSYIEIDMKHLTGVGETGKEQTAAARRSPSPTGEISN